MSTTQDGEEPPKFGQCTFDHFVMEKWDASSPLTKSEQHKALVVSWLDLGIYGRNVYFQRMMNTWDGTIPEHVPQDLLSDENRLINLGSTGVTWVRTWYGNEEAGLNEKETVTRAATDESYRHLYRRAVLGLDEGQNESDVPEANANQIGPDEVYDDEPAAFGMKELVPHEEVVVPGQVPPFMLSVFLRHPDRLDGHSTSSWWREDDDEARAEMEEELPSRQTHLVFVADRKACEEGWVLQVALNHKGQVLPFRVRGIANATNDHVVNWSTMGRALDVCEEREDTVSYSTLGQRYSNKDDGWD